MPAGLIAITEGSGKNLESWEWTVGANTVQRQVVAIGEQHLATYTARAVAISTATLDSHLLQLMAGSTFNVYVEWVAVYQQVAATTAALVPVDLLRLTTAGTGGTSVTPVTRDSTDAAAGFTAMTLPSSKGTEGGIIDSKVGYFVQTVSASLGVPQESLVWFFDFSGLRMKGFRIAAGTSNGLAVKIRAATAGAQVIVVAAAREANF